MAHASFKKIFPLFLLLLTVTWPSRAQDDSNPVHWGTAVEKTGDGIYDIRFTARIDSPWHMYDMGPYDGGPNATAFTFTPNGNYTLVGKTRQESKPSKKFDPLFDMEIGTFAGRAVFVQQVSWVPPAGGARDRRQHRMDGLRRDELPAAGRPGLHRYDRRSFGQNRSSGSVSTGQSVRKQQSGPEQPSLRFDCRDNSLNDNSGRVNS